ncbi:MAG TPA: sugar phosphate isomerase/epimerase family protein [Vicinamibacterales bacterium]|nr:sugar phosphate isomerase/epimerase family protein [Vicinamibacterales bacterium]
MTFGISTHLFHGQRLERRHLETIKSHGFDLIEIFATRTHFDYRDRTRVAELQGWLRDLGMTANSVHAPICDGFHDGQWGRAFSNASSQTASRQEAIAETTAGLDAARELGCAFVVLHLGLPRGQTIPAGDNDPGAMRRSLETLAEAASAAGVRLALEVIPNDLSTPAALADLLGGDLELDDAGICLDFGHAHMMSGAPEAAETLAGYLITTHVHDNNGRSDDHLVPFAGTIDWTTTLMAMGKVGYAGPLIFEVADHGDAPGVLTRTVGARRRLQAILEDLARPMDFEGAARESVEN